MLNIQITEALRIRGPNVSVDDCVDFSMNDEYLITDTQRTIRVAAVKTPRPDYSISSDVLSVTTRCRRKTPGNVKRVCRRQGFTNGSDGRRSERRGFRKQG